MNQQVTQTQPEQKDQIPAMRQARLPYHPSIEDRFGIDKASWMALVEAIYPGATNVESVIMALSYCKARNLDPFKRCVHIVPIYSKEKNGMVDTVWPGIGELRTTAIRTRQYAGRDKTEFGPMITETFGEGPKSVTLTFPEWAQVTVYRIVSGVRVAFAGPQVYWIETFASTRGGAPNSMWQKRPRGQLDKCAEAAALRAAFPEELGDEFSAEEAAYVVQHGAGVQPAIEGSVEPRPTRTTKDQESPPASDPHLEAEGAAPEPSPQSQASSAPSSRDATEDQQPSAGMDQGGGSNAPDDTGSPPSTAVHQLSEEAAAILGRLREAQSVGNIEKLIDDIDHLAPGEVARILEVADARQAELAPSTQAAE